MTDTWDELWETMPVVVYGLRGGKSTHVDWLNKVKAEGDRLQKEGLEHHAIAVEYYESLEAVKKYCLGVLEETKDFPNWMVIVRKLMREILKILEAGG